MTEPMPDQTPALDDFRRAYEASPKEWWLLDCGHHMNLFDEALDRIDEARDWAAWFAAERDELARQRVFELEAIAERQRMYRDRIAELEAELANARSWAGQENARLRARVAELEAAQTNPDAYIAVKRNDAACAEGPEWLHDAAVIPVGDPHGYRPAFEWSGYEFLPIVGTETGTRPATPQSDPAGYVVVTRNPEGGVHRSATVWDSLEQANTAEGIASGYADGTGCTAAVYALQEVQQ